MSLPRYAKYKHAGTEWLGDVPDHWSIGKLRHFSRIFSGGTPDKTNTAYWQDGVIPWLNSGSVNDRLITKPSAFISAEAFAKSSAKWVPKDALVIALAGQGKTKGMVAQLAIESTCNQSMAAIIPNYKLNGRFLFWWLDSKYQPIRNLAGGDLRDGLNLELIGGIPIPVIPLFEQNSIAEFLDREAVKIDELVSEQLRLIELLREKRQIVISHAVTKGLNAGAKMKSSGIKWLGDVPEEWEVKRLKQNVQLLTKKTGRRVFSVGLENVESWSGRFIQTETTFEGEGIAFDLGDILFGKLRPYLAKVYLADSPGEAVGEFHVMRPKVGIDPRFIQYQMLSPEFISIVDGSTFGSKMPRADWEFVGGMYITKPPLSNQIDIADFLDEELAKFDTLVLKIYRAIDLLQQRRTALISDAVTGKIDVRQSLSRD
jgi:type I restriction enzyme, S subunit